LNITFSGEPLSKEEKNNIVLALTEHQISKYIKNAKIHIKEYRKQGFRSKVSMHMLAMTDFGEFSADSDAWQLNWATNTLIRKTAAFLSKKVERKKQKTPLRTRGVLRKLFRRQN